MGAVPAAVPVPGGGRHPTGAAMVGLRLRVWWEGDARWFPGTVRAYSALDEAHTVVYDDGDQRLESLGLGGRSLWEPLDDSPTHLPAKMPPRAEMPSRANPPSQAEMPRGSLAASGLGQQAAKSVSSHHQA